MRLGIIVNCMGYSKNACIVSKDLTKNILPKLKKLGIESTFKIPCADWVESRMQPGLDFLPSQDSTKVSEVLKSSNNKGIIVRRCIEEFKDDGVSYVLHIDGSGKFDLEDIVRVIQLILAESSVGAVLTKRDISGMNKFRTILENFEKRLILKNFPNTIIEDGQCGCWCIKLDEQFKSKYELTAWGYEIELDILIGLLNLQKRIFWLPVKIQDTGITRFKFQDTLLKTKWLCKKLKIKKDELLREAAKFQAEHKDLIKEAEEESVRIKCSENKFDSYVSEIKRLDIS